MAADSGISEPWRSLPPGAVFAGGANSMCSDPSRLVWPIETVELAGRSTSPLSLRVSKACQPCRSMVVTVPTLTSPTRTREFSWMLFTSGSWAWIVKAPGPLPWVPGSGSEFSPRHWQPATLSVRITIPRTMAGRRRAHHDPPPGGVMIACSPAFGSVGRAPGAGPAGSGAWVPGGGEAPAGGGPTAESGCGGT